MRPILAAVLVLALVGCASTAAQKINQGRQAGERGDLVTAERLTIEALGANPSDQERAAAYNNLGAISNLRGDREAAVRAYTEAARMGDPVAAQNLNDLGERVPASDLVRREVSDERAADGALILLGSMADAMGGKQGKDKAVRCVSQERGANTYTTCK